MQLTSAVKDFHFHLGCFTNVIFYKPFSTYVFKHVEIKNYLCEMKQKESKFFLRQQIFSSHIL